MFGMFQILEKKNQSIFWNILEFFQTKKIAHVRNFFLPQNFKLRSEYSGTGGKSAKDDFIRKYLAISFLCTQLIGTYCQGSES